MIRPQLLINGRKTSVKFLKNTKVKINIKDYLDSPVISREYSNLTFTDNQETVVSFQVPPNLSHVSI